MVEKIYSQFCCNSCFESTNVFQCIWYIREQSKHNISFISDYAQFQPENALSWKESCKNTQNIHMYTPQESHETQSTCGVIPYHPILSNSPSTTLQLLSYSHFGCMALCLSFYLISPSIPSSASFYSSSLLNILFFPSYAISWASLIAQLVKNPPAMQETPVRLLGQEDPLDKG